MIENKTPQGFSIVTYGEEEKFFEPTAARCSSSSSTCCIACWG
ncbi:hypothetical protein [uncultured Actinomyces sp.]|nr:hypothetical protein [uncultured Actinomyces sp.]